ncbi:MAG: tolA [Paucimonas sp.]|jgi:colicin import membrane protein|nr:tolA [Paucimonas sp.]
MNAAATPYRVPKPPGGPGAFALAVAVHAVLLAFLWFGVSWQNEVPVAIEAEVWSLDPREAAPPPRPEPKPVVKETPRVVEPKIENPDIALEQEKKRREQAAKEEEQRLEKEKRLAEEKAEREQEEKDRKLRQQASKEMMKRLMAEAGVPANGDAARTQGRRGDSDYVGKVAAKIRSLTIFVTPVGIEGNPTVVYDLELLPTGDLKRIRKVSSSGNQAFDDAVFNAINKSQPFPKDKSGNVPSLLQIAQRMKEQ